MLAPFPPMRKGLFAHSSRIRTLVLPRAVGCVREVPDFTAEFDSEMTQWMHPESACPFHESSGYSHYHHPIPRAVVPLVSACVSILFHLQAVMFIVVNMHAI